MIFVFHWQVLSPEVTREMKDFRRFNRGFMSHSANIKNNITVFKANISAGFCLVLGLMPTSSQPRSQ